MKDMVFGGLLSVGVATCGPGMTDAPERGGLPPGGAGLPAGDAATEGRPSAAPSRDGARRGACRGLPARARRGRPGRHHVADRVRRTRAARTLPAHLRPRGQGVPGPTPRPRDRPRDVRPHPPGARQRGAEAGADPTAPAGRARLVRAVQRAGCGFRPLERADARPSRRRRVRRRRAEGVDLGRPAQRLRRLPRPHRPRAPQARGHHDAHRRHALPGHHGAAAAPDDGRGPLQRGLPRGRARAGGQRPGRGARRLARGADDAGLRAPGAGRPGLGRWRQGRLRRAGGGGTAP